MYICVIVHVLPFMVQMGEYFGWVVATADLNGDK